MNHTPLNAGPLPVAAIEAATGLVLAPGPVHFSVRAQEHAERRHPADFALCMRHVARIVTAPDYIGQGPHQADGFELEGGGEGGRRRGAGGHQGAAGCAWPLHRGQHLRH